MMRKSLMSLLLVLCCALPQSGVAALQPDRAALLQELLDRRADAVRKGDLQAFQNTMDAASAGYVRDQTTWFNAIRELPVADYQLELAFDEVGDLSRRRDTQRYGAPVVMTAMYERYRLDGYDEHPAVATYVVTFVRRGQSWLIASDSDLEDLGLVSHRDLWHFGEVSTARSEHFMAIFRPGQQQFASELLGAAEASLTLVDRAWPRPWRRRVPLLVPRDLDELDRFFGRTIEVQNFVAFATGGVEPEGESGYRYVGYRVIVNPAELRARSAASRIGVLGHELAHVATRDAAGPFIPAFVEEGLAELAREPDITAFARRARSPSFDRRLPEDWEFSGADADEIQIAYQEATSAIRFMRDRFGLEKVAQFYSSYGAARIEPGTSRYHLDRALRHAVGLGLDEFEREWAASVSGRR